MRGYGKLVAAVVLVALVALPAGASALTPSATTGAAQRNAIAYTWTYYSRGYYENNCLAYALGNTTSWLWPWGATNPSVSQVDNYLRNYLFTYVGPNASGPLRTTRIYCYGSSAAVTHFAKNTNYTTSIRTDAVRAKWGSCEIFSHANANPYKPAPYGPLVGAWVR